MLKWNLVKHVALIFSFISFIKLNAGTFKVTFDGGITFPYETTIVGSIQKLLEKNGFSLPENGDFGNPDKIGQGFNTNLNFGLNKKFELRFTIGYWHYDNLNKYGLFILKTFPLNFGLQYDYPISIFKGIIGFESLLYYNISNLTSTVEIQGNKFDVRFSDKFALIGFSPFFGIGLGINEIIDVEFCHKVAFIFREKYKNMLYFNFFLGLKLTI